MINNQFSLKNKKIIILGGNGLIGSAVSKLFIQNGAEIIIVDQKKTNKIRGVKQIKCDISNYKKIVNVLNQLNKNSFVPSIFLNCSYPKSINWKKTNFKKIKYDYFKENVEIHLNSFIWLSKLFADHLKKKKNRWVYNSISFNIWLFRTRQFIV